VFRDLVARAAAFDVDATRIAVGGDSAGGNLAAVLAFDVRGDATTPCAQLLVYPAVDFTMSFPSHETLGKGFFLEDAHIRYYRATYLAGADMRDPRASPWFRDDLSGLPPAVVVTAGFDPLRDEGDAYGERLKAAGGEVSSFSPPDLFHGFWNCAGCLPRARAAIEEALAALRPRLLRG
jgi:acetyl esterase